MNELSGFNKLLQLSTGKDTGELQAELTQLENDLLTSRMVLPKETYESIKELALALTLKRGLRTYQIDSVESLKHDAFFLGQIQLLNTILAYAKVTSIPDTHL